MYHLRPQCVGASDLLDTPYSGRNQTVRRKKKAPVRHQVARWTLGLGGLCVLLVVAKKAYFRIAI